MLRRTLYCHAPALCCALTGCLLSLSANAAPLLLVADEWCPYNCAQTDAQQGYLVDLLREVFAEANVSVEYRVVPWSRAMKMVEEGNADVLLGTTKENTPNLPMSQAVGENRSCYFAAKDSPMQVPDIDQLKRLRLSVIQDYASYDGGGPLDTYLASSPANGKVISSSGANALQNNFAKILAGRVDLVVENCNVGDYSLQHYGLGDRIRNVGDLSYFHGDLNFGFNGNDPRVPGWIELINNSIRNKRRNGELQEILHKYGLSDWVKQP